MVESKIPSYYCSDSIPIKKLSNYALGFTGMYMFRMGYLEGKNVLSDPFDRYILLGITFCCCYH